MVALEAGVTTKVITIFYVMNGVFQVLRGKAPYARTGS